MGVPTRVEPKKASCGIRHRGRAHFGQPRAPVAAAAGRGAEEMRDLAEKVEADPSFQEALSSWSADLLRQWNELRNRTRSLVREVEGWVGPPTADQAARRSYYEEMVDTLGREAQALARRVGGGGDGGGQG